jgi:hypothetical protein
MNETGFAPFNNGKNTIFTPPLDKIAPTEFDSGFRNSICHGYVHDPTSYIMGKVAGHAGVFSTSGDLQKFMVMMLNYG